MPIDIRPPADQRFERAEDAVLAEIKAQADWLFHHLDRYGPECSIPSTLELGLAIAKIGYELYARTLDNHGCLAKDAGLYGWGNIEDGFGCMEDPCGPLTAGPGKPWALMKSELV